MQCPRHRCACVVVRPTECVHVGLLPCSRPVGVKSRDSVATTKIFSVKPNVVEIDEIIIGRYTRRFKSVI